MAEPRTQRPLKPFEPHRPEWVLQAENDAEGGGCRFRITPGRARTLGRSTNADFVLDALLVSRFHCSLSADDDGLTVENLSRSNGTFVNDRRVDQAVLKAGDRLRVGRIELVVSIGEPTAGDAAASGGDSTASGGTAPAE